MTSLLSARGIGVSFPGVRALADVDFTLEAGEIHALIGENGAGKSTLVKVLSGEQVVHRGSLAVAGHPATFLSRRDGITAGIAVIPQELQLVRSLSVAENVLLGREPRGPAGLIDRDRLHTLAMEQLRQIGTHGIRVDALVGHLETADRQLVAIARALALDARVLILDEPTASLGRDEAARLEAVLRRLATRGTGVVYVSHKLDEICRLADTITVLRDGERVVTRPASGITEAELVRLMVGREIRQSSLAPVGPDARSVLRVRDLSIRDPDHPTGYRLRGINLEVRAGEIVGLAGLVGAGRTDLLLALVGAQERAVTGVIEVGGRRFLPRTPADAREAGLVLLPEERKADGIFPHLGVDQNITIGSLPALSPFGWLRRGEEARVVETMMRRTDVRAAAPGVPIATLSGGNQQKALLARCLLMEPSLLMLDEPTRGIDLHAKAESYAQLHELARQGYGILLASSELAELLTQCHRIVVFRDGRVSAELTGPERTEERVMAAAATGDQTGSESPSRPPALPPAAPSPPGGAGWRSWLARRAGIFGLALVLVLSIITSPIRGGRPVFLDLGNLTDILRQVAEKGILAIGMTAVVITGGIDLSVGSVLAFGATLTAWLLMRADFGLLATTVVVLVGGALWGLLNGVVIARWRLPAFIATLATMSAARGTARYLSGGTAIPLGFGNGPGAAPLSVQAIAGPLVPYVPAPALIFVACALAMGIFLARTRGGRYLYAIGDNESAARLTGVRVDRHKALVYLLAGLLAALAGLVHCAQLEQGNPNDGVAYELDAIAAVVIGGTALSGGVGTVGGTVVGILTIGVINNSMGLNNVDANLQLILKGIIILVAVWLQRRKPS